MNKKISKEFENELFMKLSILCDAFGWKLLRKKKGKDKEERWEGML